MSDNAISPGGESSAAIVSAPEKPSAPIKIWVVDDNPRLRSTLMEILDKCEGMHCTASFHSPNAVLSALASKAGPDVMLLDMHMGNANGLDAIRPIKALSRSTQVLMFTTFFDTEVKKRALNAGASGFLLKRFPLDQILESIQEATRNPVPHLKRSRGQNRAVCAVQEPKPSFRPKHRLPWLRQCLNLMHPRLS